jgi:hypothetical protein
LGNRGDDAVNRTALLQVIYEAAQGRADRSVRLSDVASRLQMSHEKLDPAAQWLRQERLIVDGDSGDRVALTFEGLQRVKRGIEEPDESVPGMSTAQAAQNIYNVNIEHMAGSVVQGASTVSSTNRELSGWPWVRRHVAAIVVGTLGTLFGTWLVFVFLIDSGDSTNGTTEVGGTEAEAANTDETETEAAQLRCGSDACVPLRVEGTVVNGVDEGVYVRTGPDVDGSRITGARLNDVIYGICRTESGLEATDPVRGASSWWVKAPFVFVQGDLGPDDRFSDPKSRSDRSADEYGWVSALYLGPERLVEALPTCSD